MLGEVVTPANARKIRSGIGIQLLSDTAYDRLKVGEYLQFYSRLYETDQDMDSILQRLGLAEKRQCRVSQLTSSEVRRLSIARALVHRPQVLLMEDPEQNVDLETSYIIRNLITVLMEEGVAILITTVALEQAVSMSNDVYLYSHTGFKKLETAEVEQDLIGDIDRDIEASSVKVGKLGKVTETDSDAASIVSAKVEGSTDSQGTEVMETGAVSDIAENTVDATVSSRTGTAAGGQNAQPGTSESPAPVFVQPVRFEKIPAKVEDKLILFDPTEIDYIESHEGIANLHVLQGSYACSMSLSDLETRLKGFGFYRCHRSYLVNLQKVREVITWTRNSYSLILDNQAKSSIPLSKSKYDELKKIIGI